MKKLTKSLAVASGLVVLASASHAATSIWSNVVGGFPTWYGAPSFASNAYTLSAPLPTYPSYSLVNQQHVRIVIPSSGTNTASATLNVASTGAINIVTNTITGASIGAYTLLVGGELVAGVEYDLTYSTSSSGSCSNSCYVLSWLAQTPVLAGTSQTITAAEWAVVSAFEVTTSAQVLTLPQASTVTPNGGVMVLTGQNNVTITPNAADAITMGSVVYATNTSVILPAGTLALITSPASGKISISATTTFAVAASSTAIPATDTVDAMPGVVSNRPRLPPFVTATVALVTSSAYGAP